MKALRQLMLRAAWAPLLVLVIHQIVARTSMRQALDFWMHYSGGVAIAFFLWHTLDCLETWFGRLTAFARYVFTFCMACTVGLFWEFAELLSDVTRGTHIQHDLHETMRDLIADATGAATTLTLVLIVRWFSARPSDHH